MMRSSQGLFLGVIGALLIAPFVGCGDEAAPAGTGGAGGAASSSVTGPGPGPGPVSSSSTGMGMATKLGAKCSADGDCDAEMRCITAATNSPSLNGGAADGYCTKDCLADADCPGTGSRCLMADGESTGECFLGCVIGPELEFIDDPLDEGKCHGREDLRCSSLNAGEVCLPNCGKDSQCDGRTCNPKNGFCVDAPTEGKAMGAECDADAPNEDGCAGFCQTFTSDTPSICVSACVLGGNLLETDDCGGIDKGVCIYRPGGYGAGDFGRCSAACTQHDACANPAWWCFSNNFVEHGFCFTATDCPNGDVECGTGEKCADTKYGPKCLDADADCLMNGGSPADCPLQYPLGAAEPPGSGGAGGAGGAGGTGGASATSGAGGAK